MIPARDREDGKGQKRSKVGGRWTARSAYTHWLPYLPQTVKCDEKLPLCGNCQRLRFYCVQEKATRNDSLVKVQDVVAVECNPSLISTRKTSWSQVRGLEFLPPFDDIPYEWESLFRYFDQEAVGILSSHDDRQNPMRVLFLPVSMTEEPAFYALTASAATHQAQRSHSLKHKQLALVLELRALECIRQHPLLQPGVKVGDQPASKIPTSSQIGILCAIALLIGVRFLDRRGESFVIHVRGFATILKRIRLDLDWVTSNPQIYGLLQHYSFFAVGALLEHGYEEGMSWESSQKMLAGNTSVSHLDYNVGYCHQYIGYLAQIVELEKSQGNSANCHEAANKLAQKLSSIGDILKTESVSRNHVSIARIFRLALEIRLRLSVMKASAHSPKVVTLVHNVLADVQKNQDNGFADSFSLWSLFETGKACTDPDMRAFIEEKFKQVEWRGYGVIDLYRTQLGRIWVVSGIS
ncbi:hypothetical protein VE02_09528 [Pseudogymnoascus sp. 03VT05]|nr:hypothetical protein VE02_09528 [Pseudogymnoascus sp. 03VT05]